MKEGEENCVNTHTGPVGVAASQSNTVLREQIRRKDVDGDTSVRGPKYVEHVDEETSDMKQSAKPDENVGENVDGDTSESGTSRMNKGADHVDGETGGMSHVADSVDGETSGGEATHMEHVDEETSDMKQSAKPDESVGENVDGETSESGTSSMNKGADQVNQVSKVAEHVDGEPGVILQGECSQKHGPEMTINLLFNAEPG